MLNSCVFMGRITHTPELKTTQNGNYMFKFSLAVCRPKAGLNGEKITDFIDCISWDKTAEFICKYFKKGDPIIVEGRLKTRQYEDQQGNKRKAYEIIVNNANFCAFKKDEPQNAESIDILDESDIDLPF